MTYGSRWTRYELLVAFALYCRIPFSRLHNRDSEVIKFAEGIGRSPSALAMKLGNIASLDPVIRSSGRSGLQNASANDRAMWAEMNRDWDRFAVESKQAMREVESPVATPTSADHYGDSARVGIDREVQTTARIGQDFFRATVLSAYNVRCCITGLSIPSLLVASHIVPWSHDESSRVNPKNGLTLSALHDRAFDRGLISINGDMTVRVSSRYKRDSDEFFRASIAAYEGKPIALPEKFLPAEEFLAYHREHVFQG